MFDKHADEAIEAEIWLKAEAKGRAQVREQEWLKHKNDIVTVLREMGLSEEKIAEAQARLETLRQNRLSK